MEENLQLASEYARQIKELNEQLHEQKKAFASVSEKINLVLDILSDALTEMKEKK